MCKNVYKPTNLCKIQISTFWKTLILSGLVWSVQSSMYEIKLLNRGSSSS